MGSWGSEAPYLFQLPGAQFKGDSPFPPKIDYGITRRRSPGPPKSGGWFFITSLGLGGRVSSLCEPICPYVLTHPNPGVRMELPECHEGEAASPWGGPPAWSCHLCSLVSRQHVPGSEVSHWDPWQLPPPPFSVRLHLPVPRG